MQGCAPVAEILSKFFGTMCSMVFLAFTLSLSLSIQTLLSVALAYTVFWRATPQSVADLRRGGRARGTCPPPGGPNSFNFMQFLGKFAKIVCWRPPESWRPLLGEILDPPLPVVAISPGTFENDIVQDFPGQPYCYYLLRLIPQYFV